MGPRRVAPLLDNSFACLKNGHERATARLLWRGESLCRDLLEVRQGRAE
jgi:hypothetical protein